MANNGELEIDQDLQFQRRMWRTERVGWGAMAILLICAVMGLFGNGPLSRMTAQTGELLTVEYQRFGRYQAPMEMRLYLAGFTKDHSLFFQLDHTFLSHVQITRITPQPALEEPTPDGIGFIYPVRVQDGSILVTISYQPEQIGMLKATLMADETSPLSIRQFIYP
jgi:hypothetical protein